MNLDDFTYELIKKEVIDGEERQTCIVIDNKGLLIDKFQLLKENGKYIALTFDTRLKVRLRHAVANDLNNKLIA